MLFFKISFKKLIPTKTLLKIYHTLDDGAWVNAWVNLLTFACDWMQFLSDLKPQEERKRLMDLSSFQHLHPSIVQKAVKTILN